MAAIRNLKLNLFQDSDASNLVIHASYRLSFDVFEVVDEHVYSEVLTLFDEASESSSTIDLEFGTIKATSSTIERDVDIVVPKSRFKNIDMFGFLDQLNGKISIQMLPNVEMRTQATPEMEGFVLN